MKKAIITLCFCCVCIISNAQSNYVTLYYNPELQAQVTANQATRMTSEELIRQKYEQVKDKYEKINEKVAQILVYRQQLQSYLTNVHSLISNGRQLKNIYSDLELLFQHLVELSRVTAGNPQYAVFVTKTYEKVYMKALGCQQYITNIILKEDPKYFIDQHTRQLFLTKIQGEVRDMNLLVYSIILYIENAKTIPYWRNVPELNLWYNHDKAMIDQIIQQATWL